MASDAACRAQPAKLSYRLTRIHDPYYRMRAASYYPSTNLDWLKRLQVFVLTLYKRENAESRIRWDQDFFGGKDFRGIPGGDSAGAASQSCIFPNVPCDMRVLPSGVKARKLVFGATVRIANTWSPVFVSQRRMTPSPLAEAKRKPSGE